MILIAIDTSTRWAGVAAVAPGRPVVERVWRSEHNHSAELMPAVVDVLRAAGETPQTLTHVAVAVGPGGFSAVRVGISVAIGLSLPRALPVAGVPTWDIEAAPFWSQASVASPVYALVPAGRDELSWASYTAPGARSGVGLSTASLLAESAPAGASFCGEGASELAGIVEAGRILGPTPSVRSPTILARLATEMFTSGQASAGGLAPVYARLPSITTPNRPV